MELLDLILSQAGKRPIVADLYCCQGGSAAGYRRAGYYVFGVDLYPQPKYPYPFIQGDALEFLQVHAEWISQHVALVNASPPCQFYSRAQVLRGRDHPDLIAPTRDLMVPGVPYIIENVGGAQHELKNPVMLCGAMFGMNTYRHRYFEAGNGLTLTASADPEHVKPVAKMGRKPHHYESVQYVGNFSGVQDARDDMLMDWANRDGLREAVPPQYTEYLGKQAMAQI